MSIQFWVAGVPVPQGSSRAFVSSKTGRAHITSDSGTKLVDWRHSVSDEARRVCSELIVGPVAFKASFFLPRPVSRKKAAFPDRRPDLDKLIRAALDALTGVAFGDDSQVVRIEVVKLYAGLSQQPGVMVEIWPAVA